MAQQISYGDFPVSRDCFHPVHSEEKQLLQQGKHIHSRLELISLIGANLHIFELRKEFGQRVIQGNQPPIHQFQDTHRCYRLGHGHHAVDGVVFDRCTCRHISIAPLVLIDNLSRLAHQQCSAGDFIVFDIPADCLINLIHIYYNSFLVKASCLGIKLIIFRMLKFSGRLPIPRLIHSSTIPYSAPASAARA